MQEQNKSKKIVTNIDSLLKEEQEKERHKIKARQPLALCDILPSVYLFEKDIKNMKENYICKYRVNIRREGDYCDSLVTCYSFFSIFVRKVIDKYKEINDIEKLQKERSREETLRIKEREIARKIKEIKESNAKDSENRGTQKRKKSNSSSTRSTNSSTITNITSNSTRSSGEEERKNTKLEQHSLSPSLLSPSLLLSPLSSSLLLISSRKQENINKWKRGHESKEEQENQHKNYKKKKNGGQELKVNKLIKGEEYLIVKNRNKEDDKIKIEKAQQDSNTSIEFNNTVLLVNSKQVNERIEYIRQGGEKKFRDSLFEYYRKANREDNKTLAIYSSKYGSHIEKVIANKIRCSGIQVLEAIRIYRGSHTSRPDGLCYLPYFLASYPSVAVIPLEVKSTYSMNSASNNIFNTGVPFSHLFQMLSHCALHNSPLCLYINYHRSSGCHKLSFIYDVDHVLFNSICKIMNILSEANFCSFSSLSNDTTIPLVLHSLIDLICKNFYRFLPSLSSCSSSSSSSRFPFSSKANKDGEQRDLNSIFARNIETISEFCDSSSFSFDSIHYNIYFYNNITSVCVPYSCNLWTTILSPPYNQFAYWKRLSQFLA